VRENSTLRLLFILGLTNLIILSVGCGKTPGPPAPAATAFRPYRFDDEFHSSATASASSLHSSALMADPIVWHNFFSENDITWTLLRGRMGFRKGDLVLKGEDSTPVILAPKKDRIAWGLYEAVEIRMLAEGGHEIKIKIGDHEFKQKLGPPGQYNAYRFDIHAHVPADGQPLLIMPTDGLNDLVAIRSIELIPRKADFPEAAGRQTIGKREEYRNALYAHSPSSLAYEVNIPKGGRLRFGIGATEKNSPITFRVLVDSKELYSKTLADADAWEDADLDLASYAGRNVKLVFQTDAAHEGAVGLWANPLLTVRLNRPNVLLYMIDTLRPDHTSLYGYARDTTPFLKKLGTRGLVFDDCQVQATWTKPSVASLLTSLYSFTHGIIHDDDTIPKRAATLAEQLRAAGYVTASVVANPLAGRISGLQRGFDYISEWQAVERYIREPEDRATDSAAVNHVVFPWLERHRDEPFFLYAHSTDPHAPYRPPAGFEEKFANPAESPEFNRDFKKLKEMALSHGGFGVNRALCAKGGVNPDRFIQRAVDRYDGKILHNDSSLEQLVRKLKELGILDSTLIIVVSDHGEEFWEHGWTGHGQSLYQELARGVLLMWNPKLIPTAMRVTRPVQLIDVMPTVLDLLGLKIPDVAEGQSLAPFVKGQPFQRRGPVMTSRFAHPYSQHNELAPENRIDSVALLDPAWKLIYREQGKSVGLAKVELYDRRADGKDTNNVAAQHPEEVSRMMTGIAKWMDTQQQVRRVLGQGAKATMDRQTLDQLRSLGYLGGKQ
jgi:arylsulfatase A-like enzyme